MNHDTPEPPRTNYYDNGITMARKRTELGTDGDARLVALAGQGWTAKAIADDLKARGINISRSSVDTRVRALRGPVATPRAKAALGFAAGLAAAGGAPSEPAPTPPPSQPEDLPTEEDIEAAVLAGPEAIARALADIEAGYRRAALGENEAVTARWGSLRLQALALQAKATPPAPPDPNDAPDMVALGGEVVGRLLKAIDLVVETMPT